MISDPNSFDGTKYIEPEINEADDANTDDLFSNTNELHSQPLGEILGTQEGSGFMEGSGLDDTQMDDENEGKY